MAHPAHVEVSKDGLAVKCNNCRKSWGYDKKSPISVSATKLVIQNFTDRHRECKSKEK